jgi:predicted enzyme related to lactoylglutathione lyase
MRTGKQERETFMQAVWIEIPVVNITRAATFYRTIFDLPPVEIMDDGVRKTATLINANPGISLNQTAGFTPSDKGVYVYFQLSGTDSNPLLKVEEAGGKIVQEKTSMGDAGWYASVLDTEGNIIGLYFAS